jgi:hypothetical protein
MGQGLGHGERRLRAILALVVAVTAILAHL